MIFFKKNMKIKVKKLKPNATVPKRAHDTDACYDMVATWKKETPQYVEYGTSIAFDIPNGYVGLIFPRSSITKKDLMLKNSVGVIDSGYQGEVMFRMIKSFNDVNKIGRQTGAFTSNQWYIEPTYVERQASFYDIGDRIGQIMFIKLPDVELSLVDDFDKTERGNKGFGSTGK